MKNASSRRDGLVTRRTVIAKATVVPIAAIQGAAQSTVTKAAATVFSPQQRRILDAFIDRLAPKDELGPGAVECGAADYIDRCLGDYLAAERSVFFEGLAGVDVFARSREGASFVDLAADKRDAVLAAIENHQAPHLENFFNRVRRLTLEGMFSDPYWGGNKNFAGWDLIRYPGVKLSVPPGDQRMGTAPAVSRKSFYRDGDGH